MFYEPHDLSASLSSGSERGSHSGSASGSGSSGHVTRGPYSHGKINDGLRVKPKSTHPQSIAECHSSKGSPITEMPPSGFLHHLNEADYGKIYGDASEVSQQPRYVDNPVAKQTAVSRNLSSGNYIPMDQYSHKDSGVSSLASGSYRQVEDSNGGMEDSGIDISTVAYMQQPGYLGSRNGDGVSKTNDINSRSGDQVARLSAYSQDEYLLPLSSRTPVYANKAQLRLQQLQLEQQQQQLDQLQKQHLHMKQQLEMQNHKNQYQQEHLNAMGGKEGADLSPPSEFQQAASRIKAASKKFRSPENLESNHSLEAIEMHGMVNGSDSNVYLKSAHNNDNNLKSSTSDKIAHSSYQVYQNHSRKPRRVNGTTSIASIDRNMYETAKTSDNSGAKTSIQYINPTTQNTSKTNSSHKLHVPRKHTFAPRQGYNDNYLQSSMRSSKSSSSKGSSSQSKGNMGSNGEGGKPLAANIILNIPGYKGNVTAAKSKRMSSAEESDMESMTSVSVTSKEVANIMTQAMRMHRNSSKRRSKGQCEHHHGRNFSTKPGRSGNLSRSSVHRSSNSSNHSRGRRSCVRCGSKNPRPTAAPPQGENLISFIEQSMRSFLLNSTETVSSAEDTSTETKSSSPELVPLDKGRQSVTITPSQNQTLTEEEKPFISPSLYEIATYCDFHTVELQNDYQNSYGYGMHLQLVPFKPSEEKARAQKVAMDKLHLGQVSSAFDQFPRKLQMLYVVHMLDNEGIATKQGQLKVNDFLIEVNRILPLCKYY